MVRLAMTVFAAMLMSGCASRAGQAGLPATFTRSGGFAGFDDKLVIAADGTLTLTDKAGKVRTGTVSSEDAERVAGLLRSAEFLALESSYTTPGGADRMTYTVTTPSKSVRTMDGSPQPSVLIRILAEMNRLIGEVR